MALLQGDFKDLSLSYEWSSYVYFPTVSAFWMLIFKVGKLFPLERLAKHHIWSMCQIKWCLLNMCVKDCLITEIIVYSSLLLVINVQAQVRRKQRFPVLTFQTSRLSSLKKWCNTIFLLPFGLLLHLMKFTWRILKKFLGTQHSIWKINNYLNQEMGIPFITASATKQVYFLFYTTLDRCLLMLTKVKPNFWFWIICK